MSLSHFTVSQVRVAATCPRIHYFDGVETRRSGASRPVVTRIWAASDGARAGGGAVFHHVVERFNRFAARAPEVLAALDRSESAVELEQSLLRYVNGNCIDLDALAERSVELRQNFILALRGYMGELANIANYASSHGHEPERIVEELFGDERRWVDVTFHVGDGDQAHVTGAIDYVFYDYRLGAHRIIDYKLTPATNPNKDLFQVCAYALMHHHQHGTFPHASVFYLHPARQVFEKSWTDLFAERHKIYDRVASMVQWSRFDERKGTGLRPPGDVTYCARCKYDRDGQCEKRLGPKSKGDYDPRWQELASTGGVLRFEAKKPVPEPPEADAEEEWTEPPAESRTPAKKPRTKTQELPADRLFLGTSEQDLPVTLDPRVLTTHTAVVGAAGSGKTWMAKVIAEEAISAGVPVLAIDPQGDLVQFLRPRPESEIPEELRAAYRKFVERAEVRVLTPGTSHGIRLSLNPIRVPGPEDLERLGSPERREEELTAMLGAVAGNLVNLAKVGGEQDSQRAFLFRLLGCLPRRPTLELREVIGAIVEPEAVGLDDADTLVKKPEREKLARKLNSFVLGPAAGLFSGGERLDLDLLSRPSESGRVPLNVIYLNALTDDDQKHFFLAALASEVYRWMVTSLDASSGNANLLVYIDEARDFIPAGGKKPAAKEPLIRLFTQGRKYGVGCLLCTQSPRSVDYNVFGNCSTKVIGRLEAQQDSERVSQWFSEQGATPAWVASRKGAERGSFVGRWPNMSRELEGHVFRSRTLYSIHEGAWSPDRLEREIDELGARQRYP